MSLRNFILCLALSFGVAWLAVIVIPYMHMRDLAPMEFSEATDGKTGVYIPKRTGRLTNGAEVYAENGCYLCHTQVIRPTYVGNDLYRADWAGQKEDAVRGDTRRETNVYDFEGETYAQIGLTRMGPDLSNLGKRMDALRASGVDPEKWLFQRLYNPRSITELWNSTCPPHPFFFEKRQVRGSPSSNALPIAIGDGYELVPRSDARALVSYLLSLKKDHEVPAVLDFSPPKKDSEG